MNTMILETIGGSILLALIGLLIVAIKTFNIWNSLYQLWANDLAARVALRVKWECRYKEPEGCLYAERIASQPAQSSSRPGGTISVAPGHNG